MVAKATITREVTDAMAKLVGDALRERFKDDGLVFDPIIAERAIDHYGDGDEYVDIFVIFDGDQEKLDARWINGLWIMLDPQMEELGITSVPSLSFVEKSEWADIYKCQYPRRDELW